MNAHHWLIIGLVAQGIFFTRFVVQWLVSERRGESTVPCAFWYLSLAGGLLLFVYAVYQKDPVFMLGQGCGIVVYVRNLMLIARKRKSMLFNSVDTASAELR